MSGVYENKVVLVTGARRGVGALIARHFVENGAQVVGFSRHEDTLVLPGYLTVQVDVADPDSVARGFKVVRERFGRVDIAVNSAAVLTAQYAMLLHPRAVRSMLDTNVFGTFLVSREAAKLMRKRRWGRIIHVSSMAARLEPIGDSVYAASKVAVSTLANVLAKELAPLNVTCNTLGITAFESDMLAQLPRDKIDAVVADLPLARLATPDDILNVIDFFASERSSYVTAQTVYLGGVHA
jgi:3-oxoacyl-[acyl-carrier protein] reductase